MSFFVFVSGVMVDSYSTLEEAEKKVAEIISKYDFVKPSQLRIVQF